MLYVQQVFMQECKEYLYLALKSMLHCNNSQ